MTDYRLGLLASWPARNSKTTKSLFSTLVALAYLKVLRHESGAGYRPTDYHNVFVCDFSLIWSLSNYQDILIRARHVFPFFFRAKSYCAS